MIGYLDHNATTPARPGVADAMAAAVRRGGNPSSVHHAGRVARRAVEAAREAVACLVDARPDEVVFTSGGTESNQLALSGFPEHRVAVTAVEHGAVLAARPDATRLPVTGDGRLDLPALDRWLAASDRPALVSVMAANNETGVLQPVDEVVARVRAAGGLVHCDAVQAVGKLTDRDPAPAWSGPDLISLSGHKLGGPAGIGALIVRDRAARLAARQPGGGQERGRRGGTENAPGITGFGVAASVIADDGAGGGGWIDRVRGLRDDLETRILAAWPDAVIPGRAAPRLAGTLCVAVPGMASDTQVMALDLAGVAVSAGAACSSGKVAASHVLQAMGCPAAVVDAAIRISFGWTSTAADSDRFFAAWDTLLRRTGAAAGRAA